MPNEYRSRDKYCDISVIDSRLAELEQEKQQLLALKKELQKPRPTPAVSDSFSPEQKIAIFRSLFRGRTDIYANRWENQQVGMIAKRKVNTLILVHSRQLLAQWQERLHSFLPEAEIGVIHGGKKKPTGIIDIATYQSLINKKENTVSPIVQDYGHVIVDECHHISVPRFEMVLSEVRAKYVLGLTATPERQDGHKKIIFMAAGPIRHKVKKLK